MAEYYRFPFAEAFPAEDPCAEWVTGLGLGLNDLVLSRARLADGLQRRVPLHESGYNARLLSSHVWEIAELLRAGARHTEIAGFIAKLPPATRDDLDAVLSLFNDPSRVHFRGALARARNHLFHYPGPGQKELRRALAAFVRDGHNGEVRLDDDPDKAQAHWAADLSAQLFVRYKREDLVRSGEFSEELRKLVAAMGRLLVEILRAYFARLPAGVVVQLD